MLKNKTLLEVKIGERAHIYECLPDAPLGEVHDALCQMKAFVINKILENQKADEQAIDKKEPEVAAV